MIGNHRDAWTLGALDPNSGTTCMLELSRNFLNISLDQFRAAVINFTYETKRFHSNLNKIDKTKLLNKYFLLLN
jgi:hypothetical protein